MVKSMEKLVPRVLRTVNNDNEKKGDEAWNSAGIAYRMHVINKTVQGFIGHI